MAIEKIVNIKVNDDVNETTKNVTSLKTELRKAQQEVAQLSDKFGATSKQAVEAAKRAAELKDKIGDAKSLTDAFNPDAKFKALSASISGLAGGFSAYQGILGLTNADTKEFEKTLLKVQSAMAISQGLQALGEAKDSFFQLKAVAVNAFNSIKTAIGSTGIGLLVIALGTIYTYWDDIKEAVSGVNEEQLKLAETQQLKAKQAKEELTTLDAQDETLKRQGKTEREILKIKELKTQAVINEHIEEIKKNEDVRKSQLAAAEKNKEILKGVLDFIASPIIGLLGGIDLIGKAVGKNFNLVEKFKNSTANLLFDPDKIKADNKKAVDEEQKTLNELINKRDSYHNQIATIDKTAHDEKIKKIKDESKARQDALDEELTAILDQEQRIKESEERKSQQQIDALDDELTRMLDFDQRVLDNEKKKAEKQKALDEQLHNDKIDLANNTMNLVAEIAGKGSKIGKAVAIAQATISGIEGVQNAYTTAQKSPITVGFPAYPYVQAGLAGAFSLLQIQRIASTNVGSSSAGGRASGGGGSASAPPSFNIVGQNSNNQLAQSIANKQKQPIEAYVVSGKVTSSQSLDRNKIDTATFN